jgi:hypothetical protein
VCARGRRAEVRDYVPTGQGWDLLCIDQIDAFACVCGPGYTGATCEVDIDDCSVNPCVHGVCIDQIDAFACVCGPGYTGATCEVDIDDCNPNPCFNGGDCLDGVNSFTCMCPSGYWGVQCEVAMEQLAITTQLLPTAVTGKPYAASLARTGGSSMAQWSIAPGGTNDSWLSLNPSTGVLSGTPAAANEGPVLVTIRIAEPMWPANFSEETLAFDVVPLPAPAYDTSFEGACPNGWVLTGDWECGVPVNVGPAAAFTGTQCIATQIDSNYNDSQSYGSATATSPAIVLPAKPSLRVTFRIWMDTEGSTYDGVNLRISNDGGNSFFLLNSVAPAYNLFVGGQSAWGGHQAALGWQLYEADLAAYAGQTVHLRFAFRSDSSGTFPGIYIDDVHVGY